MHQSAKPRWLRRKLPAGPQYEKIRHLLKDQHLTTVCQEAMCPNQFECYARGTATFMIMGGRCTRNCRFCAVDHGTPDRIDPEEPERVAEAVAAMRLSYSVITSVTRDDLTDGGAGHFSATIQAIRSRAPQTLIEVLIPDLGGSIDHLAIILAAEPQVLNHNLETIPRLYAKVRPEAEYRRSLDLLRQAKVIAPSLMTKSGIMVGLGEETDEIRQVGDDLLEAGCDIFTIGQYLQPTRQHLAVDRYLPPEEFEMLRQQALASGLPAVAAGPFVRSSYQAEEFYRQAIEASAPCRQPRKCPR